MSGGSTRTLHLHWPALTDERAATQLRNAANALGRLSPLIAHGVQGAWRIEVGINGLQARNGSEEGVAAAALRSVAQHLRSTPHLAIAGSRLVAALAATPESALAGAPGVCVLTPRGQEAALLAPLSIEVLRLAVTGRPIEEVEAALTRCALLGVRTLGALATLRRAELGARIGPIAELLVPLAQGEDLLAIRPVPLPRRLVARAAFDLPITSVEELRFPLRRALDELLVRVRRDGAAVGLARLHLARERGRAVRAVARLPLPSADRAQIERLLLSALERSVARLEAPPGSSGALLRESLRGAEGLHADGVISLHLQFDGVLPASGDQLTLLGARSPRVDRLAWSTAAIAIRYGGDRVLRGEVLDADDPRSERRTQLRRAHPEVAE